MTFSIGQRQPSGLDVILQGLGQGAGGGLQGALENFHKEKKLENLESQFKKQGYPEDLAKLAAVASTGGQTELLKQVLETRQRSPFFAEEEIQESPSGEKVEIAEDVGLTPKERIKREEGRFSKQSEKYGELGEKGEKLHQEQMRIQRLQELNENGNLPQGLGRVNVNFKNGELVVPFGASEDSQEFVKIVNDFLSGAKETFGARVTNFEVNRFLRRLPSLLNTEGGRRRVLRQMEIINQINDTYNQAVLDEFDKKGGVRKVDFDVAVRNARKKIQPQLKELQKEYVSGRKEPVTLTQDVALEILKEAKGDKEMARKIAKKRGYEL